MLTYADANEAATRRWVVEAIAESGATSASMMGKVMGVLMKKHKGDMDGSLAKTIAEDIFKNGGPSAAPAGAHFTCFTSTKVQILIPRGAADATAAPAGTQFTCFIGTRVQILTPEELRVPQRLKKPRQRPQKRPTRLLRCQYLYFCTSKASKLSTWMRRNRAQQPRARRTP